jgi:hypothetical protein
MILAEYRPKFVLWTSFLAQAPLQLFFAVWAGGLSGPSATARARLPRSYDYGG